MIPVIDFSKLDGEDRVEVLKQIANGCEEWGFFQLINHGIPTELLERVKNVCAENYKQERAELFKDSKPVQLLNKLVDEEAEGITGKKLEEIDWEDVFTLEDGNQWPSDPPEFKETMKDYRNELRKLALKVMEAMDENLGLEKCYINKAFSGMLNSTTQEAEEQQPFFGTKVSHYPPCPRPDLVTGLRAHTDAGGVILLYQDDEVPGLQILKNGKWIDVQPLSGAIVINTGDQIEVLSNGKYKSVWHRVLATTDGNRLSVASYYNPSFKATIAPAPQLVEEDQKQATKASNNDMISYPKFVFGDYMAVYTKQKFLPKEPRFQALAAV